MEEILVRTNEKIVSLHSDFLADFPVVRHFRVHLQNRATIVSVDVAESKDDGKLWVACTSVDGWVKVFKTPNKPNGFNDRYDFKEHELHREKVWKVS